jgi:CRP-like cAMP-binding protein
LAIFAAIRRASSPEGWNKAWALAFSGETSTEPGAVFGELSALLNQPHTADVRTLETSEFRVARAELLEEDPAALLYVAAILAQRLNLANQTVVELKSQIQLHHMIRSTIGKGVKKMEELLSATGADLVYAPGI